MESVFPATQEVGSAAAHDHAVSFGRGPFNDTVHERDHGVGIKVAEPANRQAALIAAADKNLDETVEQRIAALIQAFHGCLVHLSQPRDFSCESLVPPPPSHPSRGARAPWSNPRDFSWETLAPQLPPEPFSNFFGNGRPAGPEFPFHGNDANHLLRAYSTSLGPGCWFLVSAACRLPPASWPQ